MACAIGLPGGLRIAQANPAGSTMTRVAPSEMATEIGVLLATPPSTRSTPSMRTGGNTPGIAALARTASTSGPDDRIISLPLCMSVATM